MIIRLPADYKSALFSLRLPCPGEGGELSLLLSSSPCRTTAAPLQHDSFNLILIKYCNNAGRSCCTRDRAGSQFGRKWLLSAASEPPRAAQKFSRLSSVAKPKPLHPPPTPPTHVEMGKALGDLTDAANSSGCKSKNDVRLCVRNVVSYFRMKDNKTYTIMAQTLSISCRH